MEEIRSCRVTLCNRKAVPDSNLCTTHFQQIVDRAMRAPVRHKNTGRP